MKRLVFIVEGDTEREFITRILKPHLRSKGIYSVECFKIKHSKGGLSKYTHLKADILKVIYEPDSFVTTLIDFYRLPKDFPGFEESQNISNRKGQVTFLEESVLLDIENSQTREFNNLMPYIQLHEFEALIFSSKESVPAIFDSNEFDIKKLNRVIRDFPNPEDINDDPNTAPSKRLKNIIPSFNKILHGIQLIEEIGLDLIRSKCPRFNNWMIQIEDRLSL